MIRSSRQQARGRLARTWMMGQSSSRTSRCCTDPDSPMNCMECRCRSTWGQDWCGRAYALRQIVPTLCLLRIVEYLGHFVVDEWVSVFYLPILAGSQVYSVDIGKIGTRLHMRLERTLTVYRTHGFAIEYCDYTTRGA
jgi:hypothetical protein